MLARGKDDASSALDAGWPEVEHGRNIHRDIKKQKRARLLHRMTNINAPITAYLQNMRVTCSASTVRAWDIRGVTVGTPSSRWPKPTYERIVEQVEGKSKKREINVIQRQLING